MCSIKAPQVNVPPPPPAVVQVPVVGPAPYVSPENDPNSPVAQAGQVTRKKLRTDLALPGAGGTGPAAGAGLTIPPRV